MKESGRLKRKAVIVLLNAGWSAVDMAMVLTMSRATVERMAVEYHRAKADTEMRQKGYLR